MLMTAGPGRQRATPGSIQQCGGLIQRQAHDAGETALQARDEHRTESLDGVGAGLVDRFATGPVVVDFLIRQVTKGDPADRQGGGQARVNHQRHGSQHVVAATGQGPQDPPRILLVRGLAENLVAERHGSIRGQYRQGIRPRGRCPGARLLFGQAQHIVERRFSRPAAFIQPDRCGDMTNADLRQQLAPSRRGRGKANSIVRH